MTLGGTLCKSWIIKLWNHFTQSGHVHKLIGPEVHVIISDHDREGRGAVGSLFFWGGGAQLVCMKGIFILNKMWAQDKIYILAGTLPG
jgi:hypothetical protein